MGNTALAFASAGLAYVALSLISLVRAHASPGKEKRAGGATVVNFALVLALAVAFVLQLAYAITAAAHPHSLADQRKIATLVVIFFLIGIARAWDIIGGPSVGLSG